MAALGVGGQLGLDDRLVEVERVVGIAPVPGLVGLVEVLGAAGFGLRDRMNIGDSHDARYDAAAGAAMPDRAARSGVPDCGGPARVSMHSRFEPDVTLV
jgi:hypothetical protein